MTFFMMQLRNSERKNHGQRYSNDEKSMLLALYRHGAKSYRFLSGLFSLPSKRTLNRHSALLQFKTGINRELFAFIKSKASQLNELDKHCTICWDEMALTNHLNFCETTDVMDGFIDVGEIQIPEFATHALVFMIRGINQAYKQPVAYFFVDSIDSRQLSELITLVISEVCKSGIRIAMYSPIVLVLIFFVIVVSCFVLNYLFSKDSLGNGCSGIPDTQNTLTNLVLRAKL